MSNKLLVPQIRFKEFTNAWEQEKTWEILIKVIHSSAAMIAQWC